MNRCSKVVPLLSRWAGIGALLSASAVAWADFTPVPEPAVQIVDDCGDATTVDEAISFQAAGGAFGSANVVLLQCLAGDANCSGAINNFDISFFVVGLIFGGQSVAPPQYTAIGGTQLCWDQQPCWGDINRDFVANNFDIDAFVSCILTPPLPGVACP